MTKNLIASALSTGVHWGLQGISTHSHDDFTHVPNNTMRIVEVGTIYSRRTVILCEIYKEPSKTSKALTVAKNSVKTSFAKVKDAIRQH